MEFVMGEGQALNTKNSNPGPLPKTLLPNRAIPSIQKVHCVVDFLDRGSGLGRERGFWGKMMDTGCQMLDSANTKRNSRMLGSIQYLASSI